MPYWRLYYHFVWATKDRQPLITPDLAPHLERAIIAKAKSLRAVVHAVRCVADHAHLVASVPPAVAPASFVGQVKGYSAHLVNRERGLPYVFSWQAEYGVVSLSRKQLPSAVEYVARQAEHHADNSAVASLEAIAEAG